MVSGNGKEAFELPSTTVSQITICVCGVGIIMQPS